MYLFSFRPKNIKDSLKAKFIRRRDSVRPIINEAYHNGNKPIRLWFLFEGSITHQGVLLWPVARKFEEGIRGEPNPYVSN